MTSSTGSRPRHSDHQRLKTAEVYCHTPQSALSVPRACSRSRMTATFSSNEGTELSTATAGSQSLSVWKGWSFRSGSTAYMSKSRSTNSLMSLWSPRRAKSPSQRSNSAVSQQHSEAERDRDRDLESIPSTAATPSAHLDFTPDSELPPKELNCYGRGLKVSSLPRRG
eukprot:CAMPEP_0206512752 /NCGR_PEP_ID=MMETSP0324_2-20121206/61092_1 /ASSEMBLY_ACC=CAM_ASM_000836 /TAXON_ID=2866 /ORGANISM="Crypthecodinium cohnii, Strain Seligo" /LENGTH=167 /DNA_ID=CAMNT_0054004821 /DNA_START=199 /DNA_END=698 /DNA_ORIENTATION=+